MQNFNRILRQMKRQPLHSTIVLGSLVLSMVSCLLIAAFVTDELSVDKNNQNLHEIVLFRQFENSPLSGGQFATDLKLRFPQVKESVRMKPMNLLVASGSEAFYEPDFYFADPEVFKLFSFNWIKGNPKQALEQSNGIVISEQTALKYFGKDDPIGKLLKVNGQVPLTVQAVYENAKDRSHIHPALIASFKIANELSGYNVTTNYWGPGGYTYLLLNKGTNIDQLSSQIPAYIAGLNDPNAAYVWKPAFIPLKDLYLRTSLIANSPITYIYIFSGAALLLLLLAGFNYINLSTASIATRQKFVAIQKVLGSSINHLRASFMAEAGFYIVIGFILACIISILLLPAVNQWTGFNLSIMSLATMPNIIAGLGFLIALVLLSGAYPAWVISSTNAINALRNYKSFGQSKSHLRKILIVAQFTVSFSMILVTLVVYSQLKFIKNKQLGYNREQVLSIDLRDADKSRKALFKQAVMELPHVDAASICFGLPGSNVMRGQKMIEELVPKGSSDASVMQLTIDEGFVKTFGIQLVQGRLLDENRKGDQNKFLINETAMKKFGWHNIEGKFAGYYTYEYQPDGSYKEVPFRGEVVGVLADYNHSDLKSPVQPTFFTMNDGYESMMGIKIKAGNIPDALQGIEQKWKSVFPDRPFAYAFLDDVFNKSYTKETQTGKVFAAFSFVTIFISCLGLFGLVFFALQRRQKEISIRKVLGAQVADITAAISKEIFVLIIIACLIGMPIAWIGVNHWLEMFAYRISITGWILVQPFVLLVCLVSLSIGWHILKAAVANPVESLRTE